MAEAPEAVEQGDGTATGGDDDADPEGELQHQIRNGTLFGIGLLGGIGGFDSYGIGESYQPSSSDAAAPAPVDTTPGTASAGEEDEDGEKDGGAEFEGSELGKSNNEKDRFGLDNGEDEEGAADEDGNGDGEGRTGGGGGGSDANSDENRDDAGADEAAESGEGEAEGEKHGGIKKEVVSTLAVDVTDAFMLSFRV